MQPTERLLHCAIVAENGGIMTAMMQDLAFAIPGVDEAMGFSEVMKYTLHERPRRS